MVWNPRIRTAEAMVSCWKFLTGEAQRKCWRRLNVLARPLYWMTKCTRTLDEQDRNNPFKPFPDRPYFHDLYAAWRSEPVLFVEKSRSVMLTWFFVALCLHEALTSRGTRVLFLAPDQDRTLLAMRYAWTLYENQDSDLKRLWPLARPRNRQSAYALELKKNSILEALPGKDPGKIRGEHPTIVFMDEACAMENWAEAYDVALAARPLKLIAISSAQPSEFRAATRHARAAEWTY